MATDSNQSPKPEWLKQFYCAYPVREDPFSDVNDAMAKSMTDFLLSDGSVTAGETAEQIHTQFKREDPDSPSVMEAFIQDFYDLLANIAKFLPFGGDGQDKLVQVILELRKLRPVEREFCQASLYKLLM